MNSEPRPNSTADDADKLSAVVRWLLEGHDAFSIASKLREEFGDGDVERQLSAAVALLEENSRVPMSSVVGWALESYRTIYRSALAAADHGAALKAVRSIVDLRNAYVYDQPDEPDSE